MYTCTCTCVHVCNPLPLQNPLDIYAHVHCIYLSRIKLCKSHNLLHHFLFRGQSYRHILISLLIRMWSFRWSKECTRTIYHVHVGGSAMYWSHIDNLTVLKIYNCTVYVERCLYPYMYILLMGSWGHHLNSPEPHMRQIERYCSIHVCICH